MAESILTSIKEYVGVTEDQKAFDQEIIMNINSVFSTLRQIGVELPGDFLVEGSDEEWSDAFGDIPTTLTSMIKQYTQLKVRVMFDPPGTSFVLEAINRQISELEWRINIEAEGGFDPDE